ncbi:butyrophilin subfamily 2 member A2-like isoform X3 [Micropterus dolomieu]|uniref:butyrophilin subfamily 2 member A2-like isoform X3 n=1 Tax=Micropterus dolomieu TaxID=147949 RepID=UPI001E8EC1F2|nr:butyrophilin subfamily 2 member A2-like isoform X3 [Micropterus dolomieu]
MILQRRINVNVDIRSGDVRVVVKEGSDAILPCSLSTKENAEEKLFDWKKDGQKEIFFYDRGSNYNNGRPGQDHQFKGRVAHFQDELKYGNTSIIIRNTKVTDSGDYTCDFPKLEPRQIFHIHLIVVDFAFKDRRAEIRGAAQKPSVSALGQTADGALLQCEVLGASSKPTVEWQDSAGNKLPAEEPQVSERGGSFYITVNTTVMKTDNYRCVATQEEIRHQIHTEIHVFICGEILPGCVFNMSFILIVVLLVFKRLQTEHKAGCDEDVCRSVKSFKLSESFTLILRL